MAEISGRVRLGETKKGKRAIIVESTDDNGKPTGYEVEHMVPRGKPMRIHTTATVHLGAGPTITMIELKTEAQVPNVDNAKLQELAQEAKKECPVSKALASVDIKLHVTLVA